MAASSSSSAVTTTNSTKKPKKANLLNHISVKHLLDESVSKVVTGRGYVEDVRTSNLRLLIGSMTIALALAAQLYPRKFPDNRGFLITCVVLLDGKYLVSTGLLMLISHVKEKNALLFTHPLPGSLNSTGLMISSNLPRFSDMYTLTVAGADPKSISAKRPVQLTKSVTKWFTKDGLLIENLFCKDVERLVGDYSRDLKKTDTA